MPQNKNKLAEDKTPVKRKKKKKAKKKTPQEWILYHTWLFIKKKQNGEQANLQVY